jgi:murein DD-endopeptidase MepM/ murein hydrolase activator NlpD
MARTRSIGAVVAAALVAGALLAGAPGARASEAGVAAIQLALRTQHLYSGSIDGLMGPATTAGVIAFQRQEGLDPDGVVGPATRKALGRRGKPKLGARPLTDGAAGADVAGLQFLLARSGFPSGPVDGGLGPRTAAALKRFQLWAGLGVDGVAGPATLAALQRPMPAAGLRFIAPVSAPIGDRFGPRGDQFHPGIDYTAQAGQSVWAAARGCVSFAGWTDGGYGNLVVIEHTGGMTSWYAHLSKVSVKAGACLPAGRVLGLVGSTGNSTGPHLHFELRLRGAAVDPLTNGLPA